MVDEKKDKRPWYLISRVQGAGLFIIGVAMLFNPTTAPIAKEVALAGLGWLLGGTNAKITRTMNK